MQYFRRVYSGFTLIELMITVTLLLVISGGSLSAYLSFNKSQTMESDAREVVAEINKVRSLAANLIYPTGCVSLSGYSIKSDAAATGLIVTAVCASGDVVTTAPGLLKSSLFAAPFTVDVLVFAAGSGYLASGTNYVITIKNSDDADTTKKITVGAYGTTYLSMLSGDILLRNFVFLK